MKVQLFIVAASLAVVSALPIPVSAYDQFIL